MPCGRRQGSRPQRLAVFNSFGALPGPAIRMPSAVISEEYRTGAPSPPLAAPDKLLESLIWIKADERFDQYLLHEYVET
jgi:hypothetical protein